MYAVICKTKFTVNFKVLRFVKVTDTNPNNLKMKKYAIA